MRPPSAHKPTSADSSDETSGSKAVAGSSAGAALTQPLPRRCAPGRGV